MKTILKALSAAAILLAASVHAAPTLVRDVRLFDGERTH